MESDDIRGCNLEISRKRKNVFWTSVIVSTSLLGLVYAERTNKIELPDRFYSITRIEAPEKEEVRSMCGNLYFADKEYVRNNESNKLERVIN